MHRRRFTGLATGVLAASLAAPRLARAQGQPLGQYPDRPVRFIVPFPAGGGTDVWGRMVAEAMAPLLGQPVVVENRAGGGGIVGALAAAQAPPDGYTLFYTIDAFITAPITQRLTPYDPVRDFAPIGRLGSTAISFTIGPMVPAAVTTLAQYVEWAKRQTSVPLGNWAAGGSGHAFAALLEREAKLANVKHVAYRGEAPMLQDNIAGVFHGGYHSMVVAGEMVRAGRLRPLATGGPARVPSLADRVPTMRELGYSEAFNYMGFNGLFAPGRTPQPVLDRLTDAFRRATTTPQMLEKLRAIDTLHGYEDPATFSRTVLRVQREWTRLAEELDLYQSAT
jgi:tripartite-type tricarboxylate transporter receptor subunit TctC